MVAGNWEINKNKVIIYKIFFLEFSYELIIEYNYNKIIIII